MFKRALFNKKSNYISQFTKRSITKYDSVIAMNEVQESMKEMARNFSQEHIAPQADQIDKDDFFDRSIWRKMGSQGFLGITVPEEYGGAGLGYFEHCLVAEEISRASASVGVSYIAHSNLWINQIKLNGSEEQKHKYLPKLISGKHIGALAMSEPGAGSDVTAMNLTAK